MTAKGLVSSVELKTIGLSEGESGRASPKADQVRRNRWHFLMLV